jgi:putative ABC transport system permease protein
VDYLALLRSALVALLRNKLRSLLTVTGIAIGIAAVICVVAIGKAGQSRVEQQMNNLGDNFVWIEAGGRAVNGVRTGTHATPTLSMADAAAIKNQIALIKSVSPNVDDHVQVIYANQNWFTGYRGVSPEYFDIKRWNIDQGAFFTSEDVDRSADVCVIGRTVREQLFGAEDPIGKVIRVKNLPCKVIGVLHPKGLSMSGQDQDDSIILPYTTVQKKMKGNPWLDDILCSAVSQDAVKIAGQEAAAILRDRHHLRPDEDDDFNIRNPEDIIQAQIGQQNAHRAADCHSLHFPDCRGHRHHERDVGFRHRAYPRNWSSRGGGSHRGSHQLQFLGESVMLSLVGGGAGVLFGFVGSYWSAKCCSGRWKHLSRRLW